jgi:hypothetical protein
MNLLDCLQCTVASCLFSSFSFLQVVSFAPWSMLGEIFTDITLLLFFLSLLLGHNDSAKADDFNLEG